MLGGCCYLYELMIGMNAPDNHAVASRLQLPRPEQALPGRSEPLPLHNQHYVNGQPLRDDFAGLERLHLGLGCFWGAERRFWQLPGVVTTAVGYQGGFTPNPTYEEVCSGQTGHAEVVQVIFDPRKTTLHNLLRTFWESHDPAQGMRQGNDIGTQYRSVIFCYRQEHYAAACASREQYQQPLHAAGHGTISTEIHFPAPAFYYAEEYHQQYLAKNPGGYCGLKGTGVSCALTWDTA